MQRKTPLEESGVCEEMSLMLESKIVRVLDLL